MAEGALAPEVVTGSCRPSVLGRGLGRVPRTWCDAGVNIDIRQETSSDAPAVRQLVADAFANAEHSAPPVEADGVPGEATLVGWLRDTDAYESEFALVASDEGATVGYAVATWGDLDGAPVLGTGPIAVAPTFQGREVGSSLMRELLRRATERSERVVVLLRDPAYYSRFGFVPASRFGIVADPAWGEYFQACALGVESDVPSGTYTYAEPLARLG